MRNEAKVGAIRPRTKRQRHPGIRLTKVQNNALFGFSGNELYPEKHRFPSRPQKYCTPYFKISGHPKREDRYANFHGEQARGLYGVQFSRQNDENAHYIDIFNFGEGTVPI